VPPTTAPAGDVSTIVATRAFYHGLAAACEADVEQIEVALGNLAELELDQDTFDGFQSAQEDARRAADRCSHTVAVLDQRHRQLEEAVAATPDAARTEFYQDSATRPYRRGAARPAPAGRRRGDADPEETDMPAAEQADLDRAAASAAQASGGDVEHVDQHPAEPTRYHRCVECGYVAGPQVQQPGGCPNCQTRGGSFTPTEIVFPSRPSDEAIAQDTRDVEADVGRGAGGVDAHAVGEVRHVGVGERGEHRLGLHAAGGPDPQIPSGSRAGRRRTGRRLARPLPGCSPGLTASRVGRTSGTGRRW
jgi:rubrerythrin